MNESKALKKVLTLSKVKNLKKKTSEGNGCRC